MPGKVHPARNVFDKAFDKEASKSYRISIQIALDGFSFCVYDDKNEKYVALASWDFQDVANYFALKLLLKDFLPSIEWIHPDYKKTSIILETPESTLIPNVLFKSDHIEQYLRFNHYLGHDRVVKNDYLSLLDAENIWAIHKSLYDLLKLQFPAASFHHHSSPFIESLMLQNKNRDAEETVFVNVRKSWFDILVLKGNNLIFFNAFKYRTKEDFIYFMIYVFEQLNLNPERVDLTLLGEIMKNSALYEITYKYVRNIHFGKRNPDYKYSYVFDEFPEHFYFKLIHLLQCEL